MIELQHLTAGYPGRVVLEDVTLTIRPGEVLALLGPNGCGKSTLLRTISGLLPPLGGGILLDGQPLSALRPRQTAQKIACLPQSRRAPAITARRMVLHGRFPHLSYPRRYGPEDLRLVQSALERADAGALADRLLPELSGGQRQKVYLAMVLAQDTETILMDEPTTFLDIRHQLEVMALSRRLAEEGRAVVLVLHDLRLALEHAGRIAVFDGGGLLQHGTPEEIFQSRILEKVMGVTLERTASRREGNGGWRYYCELGE